MGWVMVETVWWAVSATVFLILLYQHLRVHWPASYFGPAETLSQFVSSSAIRYVLFRFGPPFLVFALVAAVATRPRVSVLAAAMLYVAASTALSTRSSLLDVPGSVRLTRQRIAVLVVVAFGNLIAAVAAYATGVRWLRDFVPKPEDLVSDVVSGLIAAGLSVAFIVLVREPIGWKGAGRRPDLTDGVIAQIRWMALDRNVDERLAISIAYVENAERPPWMRNIERLNPFWRDGSYGLFQTAGRRGLSDAESCGAAMRRLENVYPLVGRHGLVPSWTISQCAEVYNPDPQFARMVAQVYRELRVDLLGEARAEAPDGRSVLEVCTVSRFREDVRFRGTAWGGLACIVVEPKDVNGWPIADAAVVAQMIGDPAGRVSWTATVKLASTRVAIRSVDTEGDCFASVEIGLQLDATHIRREVGISGEPADWFTARPLTARPRARRRPK